MGPGHRPEAWRGERREHGAFGGNHAPALQAVAEPCMLRSAGGRVRDGLLRHAGAAGAIVTGIAGLQLGQEVELVLPRRGGVRLPARIAGVGVLGLLLDLRPGAGAAWREALLGMTAGPVALA